MSTIVPPEYHPTAAPEDQRLRQDSGYNGSGYKYLQNRDACCYWTEYQTFQAIGMAAVPA